MKNIIALMCVALAACGQKAVSFDVTETARAQAKDNAVWNAQQALGQDPRMVGLEIYARGDSTQTAECPQGDGWASVDMLDPQTKKPVYHLKCSTVSRNLGCMTNEDFEKRPQFKSMENHCQPTSKVPFPLPKITQ